MDRALLERYAPASALIDRQFAGALPARPDRRLPAAAQRRAVVRSDRHGAARGFRLPLRAAVRKAAQRGPGGHGGRAASDAAAPAPRTGGRDPPRDSAPAGRSQAAGELLRARDRNRGEPHRQTSRRGRRAKGSCRRSWTPPARISASRIEHMEAANEELKASNEEIRSINEELQASNEELETSKEELQSLNEELNTVNSQLQAKARRAGGAHGRPEQPAQQHRRRDPVPRSQLVHPVVHAVDEGAAASCCPRTSAGRSRHFAQRFSGGNLLEDARGVLESCRPSDAEVVDDLGRWYIRHIGALSDRGRPDRRRGRDLRRHHRAQAVRSRRSRLPRSSRRASSTRCASRSWC